MMKPGCGLRDVPWYIDYLNVPELEQDLIDISIYQGTLRNFRNSSRNKIHAGASSTGYTTSAFKASAANAHDACIASCVNRGCNGGHSCRAFTTLNWYHLYPVFPCWYHSRDARVRNTKVSRNISPGITKFPDTDPGHRTSCLNHCPSSTPWP